MIVAISVLAIVVVAVILGIALRGRSEEDGVDAFRRQIDALSSEARKPTVERVKSAERNADDADSSTS